jgi:dihydrofolate reductase
MRKLKLQMQMSLDGYVSTGPNDEQQWVTWAVDEIKPQVLELLESIDTIIIGRKLAVDYIPYWLDTVKNPEGEMYSLAKRIVSAKKIVFTKTIPESKWQNTDVNAGNLVNEIQRLKSQPGKDLVVYGGSSFVSDLVKEELIDEFYFFVNPVVLGKGDSIFDKLNSHRQLKLKKSIVYNCGILMLNYVVR